MPIVTQKLDILWIDPRMVQGGPGKRIGPLAEHQLQALASVLKMRGRPVSWWQKLNRGPVHKQPASHFTALLGLRRPGVPLTNCSKKQRTVRYTKLSPTRFKDFWRI